MRRRTRLWLFISLFACTISSGCWGPPTTTPGSAAFSDGDCDLVSGQLPEAIAAFDSAHSQNPKNVRAVYYRAVAKEKNGDTPQEAIADFTAAIELQKQVSREPGANNVPLDQELPLAHCERGRAYGKIGNYSVAIDDFTEAIRIDPNCAVAYAGRGAVYLSQGFTDLAIDNLSQALRLDPDLLDALCDRARAYVSVGHHSQEAIEDCLRALLIEPKCAAAFYTLSWAYATAAKPDLPKAVAAYEQSIRLAPSSTAEAGPQLGESYRTWGLSLEKAYRAEAPISNVAQTSQTFAPSPQTYTVMRQPLDANPGTAGAPLVARLDAQGFDLLQQHQLAQAIDVFTQALQVDPNYYHSRYGRGMAFLEKSFPDSALDDFNYAIGLKKTAEAYCGRSLAQTLLGDYFHGAEDATDAIGLQPDLGLAYYHRALAYLNENLYSRATKDLAQAIRLDPRPAEQPPAMFGQALRGQSIRYLRNDQWTDAINGLRTAIQQVPKWSRWLFPLLAEAYRGRGIERANGGNYALAIRDFSDAAELTPTNAKNYQARGLAYYQMKDWVRAIADFRQAMKLDADMELELRRPLNDALGHLTPLVLPAAAL